MGDSYVEVLVERERNTGYFIEKIVLYVLCAIFIVISLGAGATAFLVIGIALGVIGVFVIPNPDYEFEYLLIGKELSIDKIVAKTSRKTAANYDLNKMEIMCPFTSHELDSYKNKKVPVKDFSSGKADSTPYAIVYRDEKGEQIICVEPNDEFIAAIKSVLPRKVVEY